MRIEGTVVMAFVTRLIMVIVVIVVVFMIALGIRIMIVAVVIVVVILKGNRRDACGRNDLGAVEV